MDLNDLIDELDTCNPAELRDMLIATLRENDGEPLRRILDTLRPRPECREYYERFISHPALRDLLSH